MENWKYHRTQSGCPQGGIVSPILSNIYLNELDGFAAKLAKEFYRHREQVRTYEYNRVFGLITKTRKLLRTSKGYEKPELLKELKLLRTQLRKIPCASKTDKVMKYIRYADDFIIGVKGDKEDCILIKQRLTDFIGQSLKMELSDEKTLITHSNQYARFLGYDVRVRREQKLKLHRGFTKRTLNATVELNVPFADKIMPFLFTKGIIKQTHDGKIEPVAIPYLYRCTDLEIITAYNSQLRGICNYYGIASNFIRLNYFAYLMEYSCLKTLAGKHKSTTSKMINKFKIKNESCWGIPYESNKGQKYFRFAKYQDCKNPDGFDEAIIDYTALYARSKTTFEKRLSTHTCELCDKTDIPLEIHHVNKVKNLKGKTLWELIMIAKKRKTLAVCKDCHHKIHHP
jgi:hypothetical protein